MATTQLRSPNGSSDDDEPSRNKPDATWNLLCSDLKASNEKIDNGEGFSEATGSKAIVDLEQDKSQKIENVEGFSEDTGCLSKGKEIVDLEQDKSQKTSKQKASKRKASKRKADCIDQGLAPNSDDAIDNQLFQQTSKRNASKRKASKRKASKRKASKRKASKRKAVSIDQGLAQNSDNAVDNQLFNEIHEPEVAGGIAVDNQLFPEIHEPEAAGGIAVDNQLFNEIHEPEAAGGNAVDNPLIHEVQEPEAAGGIDRISLLPIGIVAHINSYLSDKQRSRNATLASLWRELSPLRQPVPRNLSAFFNADNVQAEVFVNFANGAWDEEKNIIKRVIGREGLHPYRYECLRDLQQAKALLTVAEQRYVDEIVIVGSLGDVVPVRNLVYEAGINVIGIGNAMVCEIKSLELFLSKYRLHLNTKSEFERFYLIARTIDEASIGIIVGYLVAAKCKFCVGRFRFEKLKEIITRE